MELTELIDEPNRSRCYEFLDDNKELLEKAVGSKANHQAWAGGYIDHVTEIMNIAVVLYEPLNEKRELPFSLSDALIVLFLHDLEKPWKYEESDGELNIKKEMEDRDYIKRFVQEKIRTYKFELTEEHWNGLNYVEGEIGSWTPGKRFMGPLAAFAHMCDVWSARGWYDFPTKKESW